MKTTPKMDEFAKKYILLAGIQTWVVHALFKFPKLLEDVAGIIKIAKTIEADGPLEQSDVSQNMFRSKKHKKYGPSILGIEKTNTNFKKFSI